MDGSLKDQYKRDNRPLSAQQSSTKSKTKKILQLATHFHAFMMSQKVLQNISKNKGNVTIDSRHHVTKSQIKNI